MQRKVPLPGKIFARCILQRQFAGRFGCMARISCQSQLILNTRRQYVATNWRFSRPKPLLGCVERKTCHGLPPGNAFREHFAIGKRPGTHRGGILSRQGPENAPHEYIATASQAKSASGRNPAIVERLGNAYSQRLANGAASSCGWAYCLAIALVPHESDDLFVQAVLCTRERGTLSRTWRGALNAGIRAEGADDKLAHALHPNRLAPFAQAGLRPSPRVDRNIDVRRGTNPQVKRTSSACARLN